MTIGCCEYEFIPNRGIESKKFDFQKQYMMPIIIGDGPLSRGEDKAVQYLNPCALNNGSSE